MQAVTVRELTEDALSRVAPDEAFLVEMYDPRTAMSGATARGPQGFGVGEAIPLLLPFIFAFFSKFVEAIGTEAGKKGFAAVIAWMGKKPEAQEAAVRSEVHRTLRDLGMTDDRIEVATDSILMTLNKFA